MQVPGPETEDHSEDGFAFLVCIGEFDDVFEFADFVLDKVAGGVGGTEFGKDFNCFGVTAFLDQPPGTFWQSPNADGENQSQ